MNDFDTEPEAGHGHFRLTVPGALCLFLGGAGCALAVGLGLLGHLPFALCATLLAAALLLIAALDAVQAAPMGWYSRRPGTLLYRRSSRSGGFHG